MKNLKTLNQIHVNSENGDCKFRGEMDSQAKEEVMVFNKFISVYPDAINEKTIKKINPPEPDIYCELQNGQEIYFELTECVIESLVKSMAYALKKVRLTELGTYCGKVDAFKEHSMFLKSMEKFCKKYEAEAPIELISYFNQQPEPLGNALKNYEEFVKVNLGRSPFKRIWVYSMYKNEVLFDLSR